MSNLRAAVLAPSQTFPPQRPVLKMLGLARASSARHCVITAVCAHREADGADDRGTFTLQIKLKSVETYMG